MKIHFCRFTLMVPLNTLDAQDTLPDPQLEINLPDLTSDGHAQSPPSSRISISHDRIRKVLGQPVGKFIFISNELNRAMCAKTRLIVNNYRPVHCCYSE